MTRYRTGEVMAELSDLVLELIEEVKTVLVYHRASIYKQETTTKISKYIDSIKSVVVVMDDDTVSEVFADFEAISENCGQNLSPGECKQSWQVSRLVSDLVPAVGEYRKRIQRKMGPIANEQLQALMENRRNLLSVCRKGSRSWELLKSL